MKFFRYIVLFLIFSVMFFSCKKKNENLWNQSIESNKESVAIVDISKDYFDNRIDTETFKQKYPWFQGTVSDADFEARRSDESEQKIYKEAVSKIEQNKLKSDLSELFSRIKFYFPEFQNPKVFLFSSNLQMVKTPIFYGANDNLLFIDISSFMGDNNPNYKGLERYFQKSMNPQNIVPKISQVISEQFIPANIEHQKFLDFLVYNGKMMLLQDAFLPNYSNHLKINYTPKQYEWASSNESNIWNFFVENNLIFSDDAKLQERFIAPGPFSKFYTEIDNESSPQIGIFIGWQICKKFFHKNPETKLQDFLNMNANDIFNQSQYKP